MSLIRFTYLLFLFASPSLCTNPDHEDFYTSISGMESLLEIESHLLDNLKDYVDRELAKHKRINLILEDFENENAKALNNSEEYFSSPINVFKAIKRSVVDFKDLQNYILERNNEVEYDTNVTRIEKDLDLPVAKGDDLKGAVFGLARLQKTYKLNASDLAEGRLLGVKYGPAMSASDSYYVGKELHDSELYDSAYEWFLDTRTRLANQSADEWDFADEIMVLEKLAAAAYGAGKFQIALDLTNELLMVDPNNADAYQNVKIVEEDIFRQRNTPKKRRRTKKEDKPHIYDLYEATCRGELHQTPTEERPLRCMYVDNNIPFLKLAPFKMEQLNLDPVMIYYHDVIYENEIEKVFENAAPHIFRSQVGAGKASAVSTFRTSKNTWLEFVDYDFLDNIKQRLFDMTKLSLDTAEALQVANYGIGGHYGPHYDFSPYPDYAYGTTIGNRMATALFYIADVELGGATAFPYLKLAVKPVRRSLVFWYNLHNSTDPDYRTNHAGCPVLKGSKWILNEWIHERGQEFLRPCGMQSTKNLSTEYEI